MLKIYASGATERKLLPILAEFRVRVYLTKPVKHVTRKDRKTGLYKVINYPIN